MKLGFKQTAIFLTLAFSTVSCQIDVGKKDCITGNKNITTQERSITEVFTKIDVQEGISVYITMSSDEKITVEADENLQEVIKTEIKDGILKIYSYPNIRKAKARNVYVSIPNITGVKTSSGARAFSENTLINESINVKSSSGSTIELQISTTNLTSKSSSSSSIKLTGRTTNLKAESSSSSFTNAFGLKAKNVVAKASSGSTIQVTATENLDGKVSSGGSIKHKGNPKHIDRHTSSGGNISAE
jgi:hypothetical protein